MAIYRGDGGAGDATNDVTVNQIADLSSDTQAAATAAASSATSASSSASAASTSATNAANSATSAGTSATNAASSASSASTSASNASTSETNAAASETAAAASEAAAALSETAAAASETNAASSASSASTSASTATTQASNAATSATNAANSASAASTSETNAATSETNAATSETNAASSATSASNDAATATTKASEASISATNAATSATNASTSETNAATSASNAATSETNAAASETAAASSASAAATSETNAATSASSASTSASNAATSESNAATSETNAATSETNAAASAASAASSDYAVSSWFSTTNNSSNWDTAYGWGNHASAGYISDTGSQSMVGPLTVTGNVTCALAYFEGGKHVIAPNDGGGNFNIRVANTQGVGCTEDGYVSHWKYTQGNGLWDFNVSTASLTIGDTPTWQTAFSIAQTGDVTALGKVTATGGNSTNWNTAYGWGDHASADYLITDTTGNKSVNGNAYLGEKTLTDGASISWDMTDRPEAFVVLGGNRTLQHVSVPPAGTWVTIRVRQDATGNRTLSYSAAFIFGDAGIPSLSTGPLAQDILSFRSNGGFLLFAGAALGF